MRILSTHECNDVSGAGWQAELAKAVLQGVAGNFTYDALKALINHVPTPRPLTQEELERIRQEGEKIRPTTPPDQRMNYMSDFASSYMGFGSYGGSGFGYGGNGGYGGYC